jgi:hypothetical protein
VGQQRADVPLGNVEWRLVGIAACRRHERQVAVGEGAMCRRGRAERIEHLLQERFHFRRAHVLAAPQDGVEMVLVHCQPRLDCHPFVQLLLANRQDFRLGKGHRRHRACHQPARPVLPRYRLLVSRLHTVRERRIGEDARHL